MQLNLSRAATEMTLLSLCFFLQVPAIPRQGCSWPDSKDWELGSILCLAPLRPHALCRCNFLRSSSLTCFGRTILRFRRSLLILVVWSPGAFQFVVRPKAPVKGLFVDSKYNPVLEGSWTTLPMSQKANLTARQSSVTRILSQHQRKQNAFLYRDPITMILHTSLHDSMLSCCALA